MTGEGGVPAPGNNCHLNKKTLLTVIFHFWSNLYKVWWVDAVGDADQQ
jgi:hypothetical protein